MRDGNPDIEIRLLQTQDVEPIARAFQSVKLDKPVSQYQRYLVEQEEGRRIILVAFIDKVFAGYLTIVWKSEYPPFQAENIPEIQDFNVLPPYRRRGVGSKLMDEAEQIIASRTSLTGIGVGMTADYGAAQRLYVLRGYVPDGKGLFWRNSPIEYGEQVIVEDDLILHFIKRLNRNRKHWGAE
jgi:GNAT superfamily N-acetyltransferase